MRRKSVEQLEADNERLRDRVQELAAEVRRLRGIPDMNDPAHDPLLAAFEAGEDMTKYFDFSRGWWPGRGEREQD